MRKNWIVKEKGKKPYRVNHNDMMFLNATKDNIEITPCPIWQKEQAETTKIIFG